MRPPVILATVGLAVIAAVAVLMAVNALVLDPLAAVPGHSLGEVYDELRRQHFTVGVDIAQTIAAAAVGVVLAAAVAAIGIRGALPQFVVAALFQALLVLAAPVNFMLGFALGMDVADAFMTTGGDHTAWPTLVYVPSAAALVALPIVLLVGTRRAVRRNPVSSAPWSSPR
jgi:hypothetical protein